MELNPENLAYALRILTTALAGQWYGASQYISSCESASRDSLPEASMSVDYFQQMYPNAKNFQGKRAVILGCLGVSQYFLDSSHQSAIYYLASGVSFWSVIPWTAIGIAHINKQLMDGDIPKKKDSKWIRGMMSQWDNAHWVRTVAGGLGFAFALFGMLKKK